MPKRTVTDRSLRAIRTRKKLYQSAEKLIDKHGYDNVTIEDICKKANVSVGAFYHYFSSKMDIIVEIFRQIDDYFEDNVGHVPGENAYETIEAFFRHYAKFHTDQGVGHTGRILKADGALFLDKTRYTYTRLIELVAVAKADGVFNKDADPGAVVDYLLAIARGLLFDWTLSRGEYDLEAKMAAYIKLAMGSFK